MIRQSGPPVVTQPSMLTIFRCLPMLFISVISDRKLRRSSRLAFADRKNKFSKNDTDRLVRTPLSKKGPASHYGENKLKKLSIKIHFFYLSVS